MKKHYRFNLLLVVAIVLSSCASKMQETNSDAIKVAIRAVGHELLLAQNDSTSLVLPIEEIDTRTYKLQFQKELSIEPGFLAETITRNFKTAELPSNYIIEVVQCSDNQIAYSYQMKRKKDNEIVPCGGRVLSKSCYLLLVKFQNNNKTGLSLWIPVALLLVLILIVLFILKRRTFLKPKEDNDDRIKLGGFIFYPEQHKLVKQALEISLSKKECEILEIFSEKPNEIISREELTKRIWEDNGVVVGRSLDTYISKLRKKLQDDPNIKLTNVHGIGYKLEVS
ncbi:winged helix-turn-helix domain-containing protein [Winogradskyella marincola]|uniref:Winged helix-turn-helix domain-containing protein n=1 Tax=Winogradskyella marincola TaxID=3037795 RepID=A0ABT6G090_9FLAO|nr:winged helix-turn-helix domain-containing protein [Winogradskyella sp. YYF002]MDG4715445.1 winged helix-turn-helix domain-containing protein [Winogradskyella sp. YYF002]